MMMSMQQRAAALCAAAHECDLETVRALLASGSEPPPDAKNLTGWTPLHSAACGGSRECVETLLAAGASVDEMDHCKATALHFASWKGHVGCVHALVNAGSDVTRAARGWTPFPCALHYGHRSLLKILLRAGAEFSTGTAPRKEDSEAWALVDEISAAGGWDEFARRHDALLLGIVAKVAPVPDVLQAEIAAFISPPGGY